MKNCTLCSSVLSRFRGNNYQSSDLCFASPTDKHPAPWGMVARWYTFKWGGEFHRFVWPPSYCYPDRHHHPHPTTDPSLVVPSDLLSRKTAKTFFLSIGTNKGKRENIKEYESPSSHNIRHCKTTQSYDWIYQNCQIKVDCWVSINWAIFLWDSKVSPVEWEWEWGREKERERGRVSKLKQHYKVASVSYGFL